MKWGVYMIGLITNSHNFESLKNVLTDNLIFTKVGTFDAETIGLVIQSAEAIDLSLFIIDMSSISTSAENALVKALDKYRIRKDNSRIIIIAPDRKPGDSTMSKISLLGINDIIAPDLSSYENPDDHDFISLDLGEILKPHLDNPATYADARRWRTSVSFPDVEVAVTQDTKTKPISEKIIYKERLIGTNIIAVAGASRRVGTTKLCFSICNYLSSLGFSCAYVELACFSPILSSLSKFHDLTISDDIVIFNKHWHGYSFHENISIPEILSRKYQYFVFDIGQLIYYDSSNDFYSWTYFYEEFMRATIPILCCDINDPDFSNLQHIHAKGIRDVTKHYFTFSPDNDIALKKKEVAAMFGKHNTFIAPYSPGYFNFSESLDVLVNSLLQPFLPSDSTPKKGIFRKLFR